MSGARPGTEFPTRRVAALAIAETLVWAGLYYSFPALIAHWETDLGWTKTALAGAYSVALVAAALAAPVTGWMIDAGYGRTVLIVSSGAGGVLIALSSVVTAVWQFYLVWLAIGFCLSGCLYEPCFAYVTRMMGADARRAITRITLVAGLAGTVSFPMANVLAELYSWRAAVGSFGVVILVIALPLFCYGTALPLPRDDPSGDRAGTPSDGKSDLRRAMGKATFWLLATSFSMIGLTHGIIITHLLPMLAERQVPLALAVLAASMIGPMQVAGRVAMMTVENRVSMQTICALSFLFMAGATLSLMGAGAIPWLLVVFVALQGSGYGVTSITRPVVTAEILGRVGFGAISGAFALGVMGAYAAAPTLAASIWTLGGYNLVRIFVLGCVMIGAGAFLAAMHMARRQEVAVIRP